MRSGNRCGGKSATKRDFIASDETASDGAEFSRSFGMTGGGVNALEPLLLEGWDSRSSTFSEFSFYSSPGYGITVIPCAIPFR